MLYLCSPKNVYYTYNCIRQQIMEKPHISQILNQGSSLNSKIDSSKKDVINQLIEKTAREQDAVIKLKEVNRELLKKVVQL